MDREVYQKETHTDRDRERERETDETETSALSRQSGTTTAVE